MNERTPEPRKDQKDQKDVPPRQATPKKPPVNTEKKKGPTATIIPGVTE